jgi:hypothetical protein
MSKREKPIATRIGEMVGDMVGSALCIWGVHYSLVNWGRDWSIAIVVTLVINQFLGVTRAIKDHD